MTPKQKKILRDWSLAALGAAVILYLCHFYTMSLNDHIYSATHSMFKMPSRLYIWRFLKVTPQTRINGQTPIQYLLQSNVPLNDKKIAEFDDMLDLFIAKGIDINATSTLGLTAMHYAIMDEDPKAIELLIKKRADVNQPAHVDTPNQLIKIVSIEGLTPLAFLHQRRTDKLFKSEEKLNEIEAILKASGANTGPQVKVAATPKTATKKSVSKTKNKKKTK